MSNLFLPPRSRKTLQMSANTIDNEEIRKRGTCPRRKHTSSSSDDNDFYQDQNSEDEKPRKRGRPPLNTRGRIKGFTDVEIRRFIKSFKKFANPINRLENISLDAELEDKPLSDIRKLAECLQEKCDAYLSEQNATKENSLGMCCYFYTEYLYLI